MKELIMTENSNETQPNISNNTEPENKKQEERKAGPMEKFFMYVGFGIGMVLMIAFVPTSKSAFVNMIVGGGIGLVFSIIGSLIGKAIDNASIK
jgi:hypothetical protein